MLKHNQLLRGAAWLITLSGLSVLMSFASHAGVKQSIYYRSYWQPIYHGKPLHYCLLDGQTCGLVVASRYCKLMGYQKADQETIAHNVGETKLLEGRAHCKGWQCNGFKTIRCVSHFPPKPVHAYSYRLRRYVFPRFNHYRVDWCYDGHKYCGKKPAFSFCRRMGYNAVRHYKQQAAIGATQAIGNQKLCFGNTCKGYAYIDCFR
jgi:hypothetical protein